MDESYSLQLKDTNQGQLRHTYQYTYTYTNSAERVISIFARPGLNSNDGSVVSRWHYLAGTDEVEIAKIAKFSKNMFINY